MQAEITLRQAAQQALEALLKNQCLWSEKEQAVHLLQAALAEPQTTHWEGCEAVHPECRKPEPVVQLEFKGTLPISRGGYAPTPQPEQEPVAWMVYTEGGTSAYVTDNPNDLVGAYRALPLYTAPPQRKPLTDEQIEDAYSKASMPSDHYPHDELVSFARAIERAHGIGEQNE